MRNITRFGLAALLVTSVAGLASAQNRDGANKPSIGPTPSAPAAATTDSTDKAAKKTTRASLYRPFEINHIRPADQRGVNVFEAPERRPGPVQRLRPLLRRRLHAGVPRASITRTARRPS